jgi:gamma-tubulin complex component 3
MRPRTSDAPASAQRPPAVLTVRWPRTLLSSLCRRRFQLIAVLEEQRQSSLTLLQLLVWSSEPMHRLQLMAQLVRGSGHLKGGAMTVALARQERHGDPFVRGYVRQLLRAACAPMFAMLREWLLHGEITDAHDEFFVEQRATPLSRLWESRYVLRHAMLPCFLTEELALEVLNVGKALNFIRLCCGDTQWVLRLGAPLRTTSAASSGTATGDGGRNADGKAGSVDASTLARIEYGQEARLPTVVRSAAALVNGHILELLMRKFELRAHCANLQQFLLLGKGDFVQSLMEHLAPHLARPSAQLHRHHLLSLVESAVRSSSPASFEQQGSAPPSGGAGGGGEGEQYALLLKHLDVSLTKTPGGSGWDAFCLDYNVGSPMDVMLSATAMKSYRQASTFLWRLKRVEYSLTAVWRKHCTTSRLIQNLHRDPVMHGCYLLRNEMVHFVYNLQVYLMFEVIECEWVELCQKLTAATDLEGVLSSHNSFIAAIERKAMLRPEDESIHLALRSLFDAILQFARSQDVLYMSLLEQKAAARQHTAAVGASASEGRWASKGKVSDAQLGTVRVEPRLAEQLNASASEYRTRFATFFALVRGHASYDLSFLAFRLDFNEYYESLALVREEGTSTTPVPAAA